MRTSQAPTCPKCGNANLEKISERRSNQAGSFFAPPAYAPKETIYTFRCSCGTTFTQSGPDSKQIVKSLPDDGETLALKACRLQLQIGRLADNPNSQIVGFDVSAHIDELRAVAKQCEEAELHETAKRLEQLGRDVMRRWAE